MLETVALGVASRDGRDDCGEGDEACGCAMSHTMEGQGGEGLEAGTVTVDDIQHRMAKMVRRG